MSKPITLDEAKRCPSCREVRVVTRKTPAATGNGEILWVECRNSLCMFYDETFFIQVKPDGTIPVRE